MNILISKNQKGRIKGSVSQKKLINLVKLIKKETTSPVFYIVSKQCAILTEKQIDTCKKTVKLKIKKNGVFTSYLYPININKTTKSSKTRMGKGKGAVDYKIKRIKAGTLLFKLSGIPSAVSNKILTTVCKKLPFKTSIYQTITL